MRTVMKAKKLFPCEAALTAALVMNSLGVTLMIKGDLGISTLSSVPLILSYAFPGLSFGIWNFIFQVLCLLVLVILTRNPDPSYLLTFVIARVFGVLLDFFSALLMPLPAAGVLRPLYFLAGFLIMIPGASLFVKCRLPVLPFDAIVRDSAAYFQLPLKKVKTPLDIVCVILTCSISLFCFQGIRAVGIGTVCSALVTGSLLNKCCGFLSEQFVFEPLFRLSGRFCKPS